MSGACGALWIGAALVIGGCGGGPERLMETPVVYEGGEVELFGEDPQVTPTVAVFYATERAPLRDDEPRPKGAAAQSPYGTDLAEGLRKGVAHVRFGRPQLSWDALHAASTSAAREAEVELELGSVEELAVGPAAARPSPFLSALVEHLANTPTGELLVYVHGSKVGFYRAVVRTAELAHFAGRELTPLLFDWPSHPNILDYAVGSDHGRAERAAPALGALLEALAELDAVRRVHVMAYSAGGVVVCEALSALRRDHPSLDPDALRARFRLGAVVLASADVPVERFLDEIQPLHDLAERVCVTVSDHDTVLEWAAGLLAGGDRIGELQAWDTPALRDLLASLPRLEVLDVSHGQEQRGFDIAGHHYWYRHPWVSSDVILGLRWDLPAAERGLEPVGVERFWYLPVGYPERARAAATRAE